MVPAWASNNAVLPFFSPVLTARSDNLSHHAAPLQVMMIVSHWRAIGETVTVMLVYCHCPAYCHSIVMPTVIYCHLLSLHVLLLW